MRRPYGGAAVLGRGGAENGDRDVAVSHLDRIFAFAKQYLTLQDAQGRTDYWLWEHSERVLRLTRLLAQWPDFAKGRPERAALAVAALFHDAGWAAQVKQGQIDRWQLFTRPTNDLQRELGATLLREQIPHLLPPETLRLAAEAIRNCNDRHTKLIEAQILSEAENLDEVGVMYLLRQFRQYQAEGRPLEHLLTSWARQQEYRYWDARINDCFRFEATRKLARDRLTAVDRFMHALAQDAAGADVARLLESAGIQALPEPPEVSGKPSARAS